MPKTQPNAHSDEQLGFASGYVRYHTRMYVETFIWLNGRARPIGWDLQWNAMLEDHLVHARLLINFLGPKQGRYATDVNAEDYFEGPYNTFSPLQDGFLKSQAVAIGNRAVHITTTAIPDLKSDQDWNVGLIKDRLVPLLRHFLYSASESRFPIDARAECLSHLFLIDLSLPGTSDVFAPST